MLVSVVNIKLMAKLLNQFYYYEGIIYPYDYLRIQLDNNYTRNILNLYIK